MVAFTTRGRLVFLAFVACTTSNAFVCIPHLTTEARAAGREQQVGPCSCGQRGGAALGKFRAKMAGLSAIPAPAADSALRAHGGGSGGSGGSHILALNLKKGEGGNTQQNPIVKLWGHYLGALETRPLLTKSVSSGLICATGNVLEQTVSATAFNLLDWAVFALVGTCFTGPVLHVWYGFLTRVGKSDLVTSRVKSKWGRVLVQVSIDQGIGSSVVNSGYFAVHTIFTAIVRGTAFPLSDLGMAVVDKVTSRYAVMIILNWKIWTWVSLANFSFVPPNLRVLVANFVDVLWNYLMSTWIK